MVTLQSLLSEPESRFLGAEGIEALPAAKAVALGLVWEMGGNVFHPGASSAPDAIRAQSQRLDRYFPAFSDVDAIEALGLVDCGSVVGGDGDFADAATRIEHAVTILAREGYRILSFGGDGSVTLPQLRAWGPVSSDLVVLHFDAHTDAYPLPGPGKHTTATTFTHAAQEKVIDPSRCMHIGMRGTVSVADVAEYGRGLGFEIIDDAELRRDGLAAVMDLVKEFAGRAPVYVCWDMDIFDPSCAPGVCDPTWGGLSAAEGLGILQALAGLDIVALDINTVVPDSDIRDMTANLAATVALAGLHLFRRAV